MNANDHAIFVRSEYRRKSVSDAAVYARNPYAARTITVDTNMDEASAKALAQAYLTENKQPRTFELVLDGADCLPDFVGGPPAVIPISSRLHTGTGAAGTMERERVCKVYSMTSDYSNNTTTVQVRG